MNGIFCLESLWSNETDSRRLSIAPIVEFVGNFWKVKHTRFDCGTPAELELRLRHSRKQGYGILYLAGHGLKGEFWLDKETVTMEKLADMMGDRFNGWHVHFGSCLIMMDTENALWFKNVVGARSVSGYTTEVDWEESSAMDLIWLGHMVNGHKKPSKEFNKTYRSLMKHLGFVVY